MDTFVKDSEFVFDFNIGNKTSTCDLQDHSVLVNMIINFYNSDQHKIIQATFLGVYWFFSYCCSKNTRQRGFTQELKTTNGLESSTCSPHLAKVAYASTPSRLAQ